MLISDFLLIIYVCGLLVFNWFFTESKLHLINVSISTLSFSNRLLRLLSVTFISLNKKLEATELCGEDKYLLATVAKVFQYSRESINLCFRAFHYGFIKVIRFLELLSTEL